MSIVTALNLEKMALNPFSSNLRRFKTFFDIPDPDTMMDFGLWILGRCGNTMDVSPKLEFLYEIMRYEKGLRILVEESYDEIFITMELKNPIELKPKGEMLLSELKDRCIIKENIVSLRLYVNEMDATAIQPNFSEVSVSVLSEPIKPKEVSMPKPTPIINKGEAVKEVRALQSNEEQLLRQSFVRKTSAIDYVCDIGGDVLDEIRDLESLDEEWIEKLQILETEPTVENIKNFADGVLGIYVSAINNLFEFAALSYALSSLGTSLKEHTDLLIDDTAKLKTVIMLLECLGADLTAWREHIFTLQDTADIHYLDSSFFSSCMQIEGLMSNKEVVSEDDDDDGMEFF